MKHPFWLLNSTLLLLCLAALGFIVFSSPEAPAKEDIEPQPYTKKMKTATEAINISKIYEDDLFDTYQKEMVVTEKPNQVPVLPEPPSPQPILVPAEPRPQFLEPLNITLKGIIFVFNDDSKNRAIIADNKTTKEGSYKVGDMIEDAQLVRIFSNKILLIRSNGQQEVLYLREKDAKTDPAYSILDNWGDVVLPIGTDNFAINVSEFTHRVQSLAQFIDMLDLTTVYKAGKSIGCRIGQLQPNSLGSALGLQKNDVIIKVNDTLAAETSARLQIFKEVTALAAESAIRVTLIRDGDEKVFTYTLTDSTQKEKVETLEQASREIAKQQLQHVEEKKEFAPTLKEIIERERKNMLEKSTPPIQSPRPTQNVLSNQN